MKYFLGFLIVSFLSSASPLRKEKTGADRDIDELSSRISKSFKFGNSKLLLPCLDSQVDLRIDTDRINFEKIPSLKAENILDSFFKKNPPLSFQYVYQGNSDLKYYVANYRSRNGEFLVYLLFKKSKTEGYVLNALQLKQG